jgi:hypothetical protein
MASYVTVYAAPWGDDSSGYGTELNPVQSIAKAIEIVDEGVGDGEIVLLTRDDDYEFALSAPDTLPYDMYTEGTRLAKITVTGSGSVTVSNTVKRVHFVRDGAMLILGSGMLVNCLIEQFGPGGIFGQHGSGETSCPDLKHCTICGYDDTPGYYVITLFYGENAARDVSIVNTAIITNKPPELFIISNWDRYSTDHQTTFLNCWFSPTINLESASNYNMVLTDCIQGTGYYSADIYIPYGASPLIDGGYSEDSSWNDPDLGDGTRAEWPSLGFVAPDIGVWGGPDRLSMVRQIQNNGSGGPMTGAAGSYLVYDRSRDIWLSFTGFNVVDGHALNYGSTIENILLLLSSDGIVNQYPGAEISDEYCEAETGRVDVSGVSIIKSVMGDFERDRTVKMVLRNELDDGELMGVVPDARRNVWHRIAYDRSRGYRFSVKIIHALRLYKVKLEMKVRGQK